MAIIESLGIEVKIMIDGQPAPEYNDPDADPDAVVENDNIGPQTKMDHCYIECRENKEFEICVKILDGGPAAKWLKKGANSIMFSPSFNGNDFVQGTFVTVEDLNQECLKDGIFNWETKTTQKFRFAAVATHPEDEQSLTNDEGLIRKMGLLRVSVRRNMAQKKTMEKKKQKSSRREPKTLGLDGANLRISEQSLKGQAVSLGATLSAPVNTGIEFPHSDFTNTRKDKVYNPYALFLFKYRSREDLIKSMIIPRPRSSTPALAEDEGSQLAAGTPRQPTVSLLPCRDESVHDISVTTSPKSPAEPVTDAVEDLPHTEVLRLAGERIKDLPLRKLLSLAGAELGDLPFRELVRLATEKLADIPFKEVLQLASEKLAQLKDQPEQPKAIKREGGAVGHPERTSQQPVSIKREAQGMHSSGRPLKSRRVQGGNFTVDLTGDD